MTFIKRLDGSVETVARNLNSTKNTIRFLMQAIRAHPGFLGIALKVAWRNITMLADYNLMDGKSLPPKSVVFRVTSQCNLFCKMCIYRHAGFLDSRQMLPFVLFKQVIDQIQPYRLFVSFTGGEPLLHPQIIDCLNYVKEKGLCCSMATNGWSLAQKASQVARSGLDLISVSIDGPHEIQDRIRGVSGVYNRAMEGIQELRRQPTHPVIFINTSIQADSYRTIPALVDEAIQAGVDGMNVQVLWTRTPERAALHNQLFPEFPVREGWVDESLSTINFEELGQVLKEAREKHIFLNIFPSASIQFIQSWYTNPTRLLGTHRQMCPWMLVNVFDDGTMRMCDDIVLGDLHQDGFWNIWNGEKACSVRRSLRQHRNFPICAGCCSMYRDHAM